MCFRPPFNVAAPLIVPVPFKVRSAMPSIYQLTTRAVPLTVKADHASLTRVSRSPLPLLSVLLVPFTV